MIVRSEVFDAFKWASIGAFVIAIAIALVFVPKNVDHESELAAKVRRRALVALGAIIALAFVGFVGPAFGAPVVIVKNNADKTRATLFGSHAYAFQDGHTRTMTASAGRTTFRRNASKAFTRKSAIGSRGNG